MQRWCFERDNWIIFRNTSCNFMCVFRYVNLCGCGALKKPELLGWGIQRYVLTLVNFYECYFVSQTRSCHSGERIFDTAWNLKSATFSQKQPISQNSLMSLRPKFSIFCQIICYLKISDRFLQSATWAEQSYAFS